MPGQKRGPENDLAIGRSRGGLSTKIHATVDALGNPTGIHLTAGQAHDLEGSDILLEDTPAQAVIADKAYDAQERVIEPLIEAGKQVVIPPRNTRKEQRCYDRHLYQARHLIENFFARLKQYRDSSDWSCKNRLSYPVNRLSVCLAKAHRKTSFSLGINLNFGETLFVVICDQGM